MPMGAALKRDQKKKVFEIKVSTLLVIGDVQIRMTTKCHIMPTGLPPLGKLTTLNMRDTGSSWNAQLLPMGGQNGRATLESSLAVS